MLLATAAATVLAALLTPAAPPMRKAAALPKLPSIHDENFLSRKFKYGCDICALRLEKKKHLEEHLAGKKHRMALERADSYWDRYCQSSWYDPTAPRSAVVNAFSFDAFLEGLVRRTRMGGVQPTLTRDGGGCV